MSETTRVQKQPDYTRTCDKCSRYIEPAEPMHRVLFSDRSADFRLPVAWYGETGFLPRFSLINHLCAKCHFAARLEGLI